VLIISSIRQHVTQQPDNQKNFLVVDQKTDNATIEAAFDRFTEERKDIAILLINQHVCCALWEIMLELYDFLDSTNSFRLPTE
jgi:vacuolar-type H+-ATPase subunit F/Vma7